MASLYLPIVPLLNSELDVVSYCPLSISFTAPAVRVYHSQDTQAIL